MLSLDALLKNWAGLGRRRRHEETIVFLLTLIIGAVVGLLVVAFILLTENLGARMYPAGGAAWRRVLIPIFGALVTGVLIYRYFPNARGSGIPQTKTALFLEGGAIRLRTVIGKFVCSSVSLASGIALGREGPAVQVGAGIASTLGRNLGLGPGRIRSLIPIGASAALAAAFNTPIAGVLFTLEEVMGDLHAPVLGAIVLSSATSWMVLHLLLGDEPLFHVPAYQLVHPVEFLFYAALGVAGGLVSVAFVKFLLWQRRQFLRMPVWSRPFQPVAGGMAVGLMGWFVPDVLGVGYNHVSQALNGQLVLRTMLLLVALKLIATAACYASGNAGGIFGPSLFIGAMLGGSVGGWAHSLLPDYTAGVGAYALVGMGTAFAGIVRVPLTSVIMIFEVTRDYSIIVPLMIANLISYFISSRLQPEPVYEALLAQDGIHLPAGARSREELVLVQQGMRPAGKTLAAEGSAADALASAQPDESAWPVMGPYGLAGVVSKTQLEDAVNSGHGELRVAMVLPVEPYPRTYPDDPIDSAIRRMLQSRLDLVPVVSRANARELLGVISMADALAAFRVEAQRDAEETPYLESRTPVALLGGVLAVLVLLVATAGFLNYFYREERSSRATQYYAEANQLMAQKRYADAIQQYRNALSISHSARDRLALAEALERAGRPAESEVYFRELLRDVPNSGPANLGLARASAVDGREKEAVNYYHRAIYGSWPRGTAVSRIEARIELVQLLGKAGDRRRAQAELLALLPEMPDDPGFEKRAGGLLLSYGLPKEAAAVFREALGRNGRDPAAHAGLGEAEIALGDYGKAADAFRAAVQWNPADTAVRERLQTTEQVLALDPNLSGLRSAERYQRSRKLLEAALGEFDQCSALTDTSPALADTARKVLLNRRKPRSYSDARDEAIGLAAQLWNARVKACGMPADPNDPLRVLMPRLQK